MTTRRSLIVVIVALVIFFTISLVRSQSTAIIELIPNEDGTGGEWFWVATPTFRVITTTPGPSQTPWIITNTPESVSSPTPEDFRTPSYTPVTPSITPTPTSTITSTPVPGCLVQNTSGFTLYVRTLPKIDSSTYVYDSHGQREYIDMGQYIHPEAYYADTNGYVWYKHLWVVNEGNDLYTWSAASYRAYDYLTSVSGTGDCATLPYEDPFPPAIVGINDGVHLLTSSSAVLYARSMGAAKCLDNSYNLCLQMKQANPELIIIARTYTHDCVPVQYLYNADAWWNQIKSILPDGFDFYEIENECAPPPEYYPQWALFSIDMATLVSRDKHAALLAFSFGPGWPDYPRVKDLVSYFKWVENNPAPNGHYHGVAWHASPYATFSRPDMSWVNNPHITPGRLDFINYELQANGGPNLRFWKGEIYFTELGLSDGYSGNWSASYSCNEVKDAYFTTKLKMDQQGMANGFTWWNFGKLGKWSDDSACSDIIWG